MNNLEYNSVVTTTIALRKDLQKVIVALAGLGNRANEQADDKAAYALWKAHSWVTEAKDDLDTALTFL